MINSEELKQVLKSILSATERESVKWLPAGDSIYRASFPKSSVTVAMVSGGTFRRVRMAVINMNGDEVGAISGERHDAAAAPILKLYTLAERQALKVDTTIKDILENLE